MLNRANGLLITLMLLCSAPSLTGCGAAAGSETFVPVAVQYRHFECPAPPRPELPLLDNRLHVGSLENLDRLMWALDIQSGYIDALETAIDCYEQRRILKQ